MKLLNRQRQLTRTEQQQIEKAEIEFSDASNALDSLFQAGKYATDHVTEIGEVVVRSLEMAYLVLQKQTEFKRKVAEDLWEKATRP